MEVCLNHNTNITSALALSLQPHVFESPTCENPWYVVCRILLSAGFRMALSSVRNHNLLSSQLARTGVAKKKQQKKQKKTP